MSRQRDARPPDQRFRDLYGATYDDVLRFVQRRVHPSHAEDVVADTFVVAWRRVDDLPRLADDQRAWLFGIARNCLLNSRRGQGRHESLAVRIAEAGTTSPALLAGGPDPEYAGLRLDLARAWRKLSDEEQEVLALSAFDELTSPQAGRVLGISSAAFRLRLMRARRSLRGHLDPAPDTSPSALQLEETQP